MKILKPKFWDKKINFLSILLLPLAILFQLLLKIKEIITPKRIFKIPIICVGNIYVGGTGKTPLAIFIAKKLIHLKKKPAIIKKYYYNQKDEHDLIKNKVNCLFLDKIRHKAIQSAEKKLCDIAILDDGFQDTSIEKNINILCFNSNQLIGNGMTLPAGPLRERISAVKKADIVIMNGNKENFFEEKILSINKKIEIFYSNYQPKNISDFKDDKLFAFAGIGNPNNFFKMLDRYELNLKKTISFPDHYQFNVKEIQNMVDEAIEKKFTLITTEKDYYRIKDFGFNDIKFLEIELKILQEEKFMNKILSYL